MAEQTPTPAQSSGLAPNIASLLCYVCTIITGIVFLVIEKENKEVKFHAWQAIILGAASIIVNIGLSVIGAILGTISGALAAIIGILSPLVALTILVAWVICMVKAYQGQHFKLPVLGDIAEKQAAK